uniref:Uncharacterized protein n=1 Tax=Leersia perrieri TaxID=77586 RepID=A0A0D9VES5_9ORYZ
MPSAPSMAAVSAALPAASSLTSVVEPAGRPSSCRDGEPTYAAAPAGWNSGAEEVGLLLLLDPSTRSMPESSQSNGQFLQEEDPPLFWKVEYLRLKTANHGNTTAVED